MTSMSTSVIPISNAKASALRYLSCLRPQDILVLQGPPLLGAAFALHHFDVHLLLPLATLLFANIFLITHVLMLNDWAGLTTDLADPNKAASVFTAKGVGRREISGLTAAFLGAALILFSRLGVTTLMLAIAIAVLSALYSLP